MPPKKGKGKEKGKKKKEKKGVVVEAGKLLKAVLKAYEVRCAELDVAVCLPLKKQIKAMIEEDKLLQKFLIDPQDRRPVNYWEDEDLETIFPPPGTEPKQLSTKEQKNLERIEKKNRELESKPLVKLLPLIDVLRAKRYVHIFFLHVWEIHLDHDDMLAIAGMLNKGIYTLVKIELLDCFISPYSLTKFAPSMSHCRTLTELSLDYNEFGDEGCKGLMEGLLNNRFLLSLSLCYCELSSKSGLYLSKIVSSTPIRNLYLNGNNLEAQGVIAIIGPMSDVAEMEQRERVEEEERKIIEAAEAEEARKNARRPGAEYGTPSPAPEDAGSPTGDGDSKSGEGSNEPGGKKKKGKKKGGKKKGKKGKGKKGKKGKGPPPLPPIGPHLEKIHLADNGIDHLGKSGNIAPMRCMQLFRSLIANGKDIQEIDLFGNDIGDLGSRQLLEGLTIRKENKLPQIGLSVGHRVNSDTFDLILKLAPGLKKKKGRGKGKKKKK